VSILLPAFLLLGLAAAEEPWLPADDQRYEQSVPGEVASDPWWRSLDDPDLERLVELGLRQNHDLASAEAAVRSARAMAAQAGAALAPLASVDLASSTSPTDSMGFQFGGGSLGGMMGDDAPETYTSASAMVKASWQPDIWGGQILSWRAGRFDLEATRGDRDAAALAVSTAIASTWYDLVATQAQLRILEDQRRAVAELLEGTEARWNQGDASGLDVLQQRQQLAATEAQLPAIRAARTQLERALLMLLAQPDPAELPGLPSALPEVPSTPPTGVPADLLENRPDLRAAMARYESSEARARAALRSFLPKVGLAAQAGRQYFVTDETKEIDTWTVSGSVSVPLWQARGAHTGLQTSRAASDAAAHALSSAALGAVMEVEAALAVEAELRAQVEATGRQVEAAALAFEQSREHYLKGVATYPQVLVAQQADLQARVSLLSAQRSLLDARISLHEALGGRWTAREVTP
jgi:NodT family efflux transporter outer membrane factor (OMF) lipoprotein